MVVKRVWKRPPNRSAWLSMLKAIGAGASGAVALKRYISRKRRQARRNTTGALRRVARRRFTRPALDSRNAGRNRLRITYNPKPGATETKRVMNDWGSTKRNKGGPGLNVVMYKALKSQLDKNILYFRGVNPFGTTLGGYYKMNYGPTNETPGTGQGNAGATASWAPFYALSLNSGPQADSDAPCPIKRMNIFTAATAGVNNDAGIRFVNCNHLTTGGTAATAYWQIETSGQVQTSSANSHAMGQKALLMWQQVKLNLYGCKTRPIKYQIMIVQFKEKESYDPFMANNDVANTGQLNANAQQIYQEFIKQLTWNPIDKVNVYNSKKAYRIIHSETITIDPPKTIDQDQVPNVHTWKYFSRPGALCDFAHVASNSAAGAAMPVVDDVNFRSAVRSDIQRVNENFPHNHTVLLISATDFGSSGTSDTRAVFSSDVHGSFDAYVRSCWTGNRYS